MAKEKILIVDDEEDILELVRYNLGKGGYQTSCVATGEDAVKRARADLPDLVVLDLMLPEMDGLEVCKVLKKRPEYSDIPVILLSARGRERDKERGLALGAADFMTKPYSPSNLLRRVRELLSLS